MARQAVVIGSQSWDVHRNPNGGGYIIYFGKTFSHTRTNMDMVTSELRRQLGTRSEAFVVVEGYLSSVTFYL